MEAVGESLNNVSPEITPSDSGTRESSAALPSKMKAAFINKYSTTNDVVCVVDNVISTPTITKPTHVLVKICAASVNPLDFKVRQGKMKLVMPRKFPLVLGNDYSGIVVQIGSDVNLFNIGDEVVCRMSDVNPGGAFAQYIVEEERFLARKPKSLTHAEAASLALVGVTSWQVLHRAKLPELIAAATSQNNAGSESSSANSAKTKVKCLITAGAGGFGSCAVQMAKALGPDVVEVICTASESKMELCKKLGADRVLHYRKDKPDQLLQGQIEVVMNSLDQPEPLFPCVKKGGSLISINGIPAGEDMRHLRNAQIISNSPKMGWYAPQILNVMTRRIRSKAKSLGIDYCFLFLEPNGKDLASVMQLVERGLLKPVIDRTYSLDQIKDAIDYVEQGHASGKVVIQISA